MNHEATKKHEEARRSDKNGVVDVSQFHDDRLFFDFSAFLRVLRAFVVKIIALSYYGSISETAVS